MDSTDRFPIEAALRALHRTAPAPGRVHLPEVDSVLRSVLDTLAVPGQHAKGWLVSPDGTSVRHLRGTLPTPAEWERPSGPLLDVLETRRVVEIAVADRTFLERLDLRPSADSDTNGGDRRAGGSWTDDGPVVGSGREPSDDALAATVGVDPDSLRFRRPRRHFGRFAPVVFDDRLVAVVGIIREPSGRSFDDNDRDHLDLLVDELGAWWAWRRRVEHDLRDVSPGLVAVGGVVVGETLLRDLGTVGGDVFFRHRFGAGTEYISPGVDQLLGYSADEFRADAGLVRRVVHPDDRRVLDDAITSFALPPRHSSEPIAPGRSLVARLLSRDGELSWHLIRLLPIRDADGVVIGVEGLSTDVTDLKLREAALVHQARSDPLTKLANRLTFNEFAARAISRLSRHAGMSAVLFVDLDGFKAVNDSLGHAAGDELLVQVAERLLRVVRREDVVARLGGDEFAVLLSEIAAPSEATITAQRILDTLRESFAVGGSNANINSSIGIAVTASAVVNPELLLQRADAALYQAKRAGRGRWQLFGGAASAPTDTGPAGDTATAARATRERSGPTGGGSEGLLSRDSMRAGFAAGQFRVHYLPEIDATTGEVLAVEALARWAHPSLGLLDAQVFIDRASDDTGGVAVIHALGEFVLRDAAAHLKAWRERYGIRCRLRVNVSGAQLARTGMAASFLNALSEIGLAPTWLGLDIAESVLAGVSDEMQANLHAFLQAGVRLGIDDFGTGRAPLPALRRFPFEQIKLHPTLLETRKDLVPVAIDLARALGARTLAEGIAGRSALTALSQLGVDSFQGFVTGEAQPPEAIEARLAASAFNFGEVLADRSGDTSP